MVGILYLYEIENGGLAMASSPTHKSSVYIKCRTNPKIIHMWWWIFHITMFSPLLDQFLGTGLESSSLVVPCIIQERRLKIYANYTTFVIGFERQWRFHQFVVTIRFKRSASYMPHALLGILYLKTALLFITLLVKVVL